MTGGARKLLVKSAQVRKYYSLGVLSNTTAQRSGMIEVELIVARLFGLFLAACIARLLDRLQVFRGHVAGDVDPIEAGSLELGDGRVDLAHGPLQPG